jgi:lysophospholipase L1-like esterase
MKEIAVSSQRAKLVALLALVAGFSLGVGIVSAQSGMMPIIRTNPEGKLEFVMSWHSEAGASYQFERSPDLTAPWEDFGDPELGTGQALSFVETIDSPAMFYRLKEVAGPPKVRWVATVGDSITAETSQIVAVSGTNYWPGCWPTHLRTLLNHRVSYARNPLTGCYTFATSGARTSNYVAGGSLRSTWEAALASDTDTLMMMFGANDIARADVSAEATIANILTLWDEAITAGKQMIGLEILGVRADHGSASFFRPKQIAVNAALKAAAAERHMLFIECAQVLDDNGDGFSDSKYLVDNVHPGFLGGMKLADFIASKVQPRLHLDTTRPIPIQGSPAWVTNNSFPDGQLGANQKATGWSILPFGNAAVIPTLIERNDGVPGYWQQLDISGMTDAGCLKANPTDFIQVYSANFAPSIAPGERLVMVAEVELVTPFWNVWAEMNIAGMKSGDHYHNGGMGSLTEKPAPYRGLLITEEWSYTSGSPALAILKICGNGTIKVGRLGIFKVPG